MATYYNHCQVGIVDASGNVNVIYPQTYASDVKVGTANSSIGITTSSTVQSLISALGSAATKNVGDLVTNSSSSSSTSQAYSCNQINSKLNELNSNKYYVYNRYTASFLEIYLDSKNGGLAVKINGGDTMILEADKWV